MIRVEHITKSFAEERILNDINLTIASGELMVILGESGTGKSVLLKHMIGLIRPDSGRILIGDENITAMSEPELLKTRRHIGYLFQEGALYDFMNVFENIAFPLREHTRMKKDEIRKKIRDVLKMLDLQDIETKLPSQLSGGMKKRVALARAIILDSDVLFCDEPTSGLDPIRSRDISDLIRAVAKRLHCTTVVTSHDITNSFRIADRLALLHKGRVAACGTPGELKASEDAFVQEFIG